MKDLNIDWLLSLPRPIIVGAKVAKYLKENFPELEIVDYSEYSKISGKDNNIYFNSKFNDDVWG